MADLSKIKLNGTIYNFKDVQARNSVENAMIKDVDYVTAGQREGSDLGQNATAEGEGTRASGDYSHTEGFHTSAFGLYSHAEGNGDGNNSFNIRLTGEGNSTEYTVNNITIPNGYPLASLLGAVYYDSNDSTNAILYFYGDGNGGVSEIGLEKTLSETAISNKWYYFDITSAVGNYSHSEGNHTKSVGECSHAEGDNTFSIGTYSHAEGNFTIANGTASHSEGNGTIANGNYQHAEGKYNIEDTNNTYAKIVGNGTGISHRANAYTLDWSGNGIYAGKLTVGTAASNNMDVPTLQQVNNLITTSIGNINSFDVAVVASTASVSSPNNHTIYFVPQAVNSSTHDEYMYINNTWELIGTTTVDLSGYLQSSDIADWAKASTKPSYTASEVGAMSTSHAAAAITSQDISNWNAKPNSDTNTTYSLSISGNRITLTPSSGTVTYVDLPVYNGEVDANVLT